MKLQSLLMICLFVPTASAVMAPSHIQTNHVAIYVDLEAPANVSLVIANQKAVLHDAEGRVSVEALGVPDGLHVWTLRIEYQDHVEIVEGVVSVLDVRRLIQSELQGPAQAASQARQESRQAAQDARSASQSAHETQEALKDVQAVLVELVAKEEERQAELTMHELHVLQELEAHHAGGEESARQADEAVEALGQGVSHLGIVVVLGAALLAWYVAQVRRNGLALYERALIRAVAARMKIQDDADEITQALKALDLEERRSRRLLRGGPSP